VNRATIIYTSGVVTELDHKPSLIEAQAIIGGYITAIYVTDKIGKVITLIMDEEGINKNSPVNAKVSELYNLPKYIPQVVGRVIALEGWRSVR
jgi:hypothetical protein